MNLQHWGYTINKKNVGASQQYAQLGLHKVPLLGNGRKLTLEDVHAIDMFLVVWPLAFEPRCHNRYRLSHKGVNNNARTHTNKLLIGKLKMVCRHLHVHRFLESLAGCIASRMSLSWFGVSPSVGNTAVSETESGTGPETWAGTESKTASGTGFENTSATGVNTDSGTDSKTASATGSETASGTDSETASATGSAARVCADSRCIVSSLVGRGLLDFVPRKWKVDEVDARRM